MYSLRKRKKEEKTEVVKTRNAGLIGKLNDIRFRAEEKMFMHCYRSWSLA